MKSPEEKVIICLIFGITLLSVLIIGNHCSTHADQSEPAPRPVDAPPLPERAMLSNQKSSKYLAVASAGTEDGDNVIIYDDIGQNDIWWVFVPQGDDRYKIRNLNSQRYLAVAGCTTKNGGNVVQWHDAGQPDIIWEFERIDSSCYKIRNLNSRKYLAVKGAALRTGANVVQWQDVNQADIVWCLDTKTTINPIHLEKYVKDLIKLPIRLDKTGVPNPGKYWERAAIAHYKTNLGMCDLHAWVHSSQSLCLEHPGDCQNQDCQQSGLICAGSPSCKTGGGVVLQKGFDTLKITKFETSRNRISSEARMARIKGTVNLEASTSSLNSCGLIECECWMAPGVCCIHPHACTELYIQNLYIDLDIFRNNDECQLEINNVNFKLEVTTSGLWGFEKVVDYIVNKLIPLLRQEIVEKLKKQLDSNAKKYMCTLIGSESPDINMTEASPVSRPEQLTNLEEMPFNVLSYNVMAFPYFIEFSGQNERLNAIVQKLVDLNKKYPLDIIGINELWTGHDVMGNASPFYDEFINKMKVNWPYVSDTTSGGEVLNSGLCIFSKWPIVNSKAITFLDCKDEDCLASKGALFVQVNKTISNISKKFNLIITHPQAGNIPEIQEIRKKQFQFIKDFVTSLLADKMVSTSEPLIFLGDMNMNHFDKENFPGEYEYLVSTLEAKLPKITDEKGDDWQSSSYYKDNCPEPWANRKYQYPWTVCNHLKKDLAPRDKNEWLDYVLYGVKFQKPMKSRVFTVMEMKQSLSVPWSPGKFAGSLADAKKNMKSIKDLSDHHPLLGEMVFKVEKGCWRLEGAVLFDFDKYDIKPEAYPLLDDVARIVKQNPEMRVEIEGHTDNVGSAEYNQGLSERRAKAVMDFLVERGIDAERLSSVGYGLSQPVASNDTKEGRAQNRRAQLKRH